MRSRIQKKWVIIAGIWTLVIGLTGWNVHLSGQIQDRRQAVETLRLDMRFLQNHQGGIEDVLREKARLTHPVPSFSLGFVVVENDLKRLSWDFGLEQMKVQTDPSAVDTTPAPLSVEAAGRVPSLVGWLSAVEEAYPYISVRNMEIVYDPQKRVGQLRGTLTYHYTLASGEQSG